MKHFDNMFEKAELPILNFEIQNIEEEWCMDKEYIILCFLNKLPHQYLKKKYPKYYST